MQKQVIVALLIASLVGGTMALGCDGLGLLGGGGGGALSSFTMIPIKFIGALLLDQLVGPLIGDPAGDLFNPSGSGGGSQPTDD